MNTKLINHGDKWAQFGRIIKDPKSVQTIDRKLSGERVTAYDLVRLQIVGSGIVFGQVLAGRF